MNTITNIKDVESLFLRLSIPEPLEHDLDICYDVDNDRMVYSWQDAENSNLPLIFSIPSYIVGYIKGNLGSKRFNKLKRGLLRAIREDYKNGTLLYKNNCMDTLLADFGLFINSIAKL